jgi:hypothetical protein
MEHISFTDSDGVSWTVREDGADDARSLAGDAQPGTSWLRFDSELEVRRLWHYPDDWRGLNPVQLETLLDRASTVIARFRSVPRPRLPADIVPGPAPKAPADPRATQKRPDPISPGRPRPENGDEV